MTDTRTFSDRLEGREAPVLVEGVPVWLAGSLTDWVQRRLWLVSRTGGRTVRRLNRDLVRELERHLRSAVLLGALSTSSDTSAEDKVIAGITSSEEMFLNSVDFLLRHVDSDLAGRYPVAERLDEILSEAGSAYSVEVVGDGVLRLSARVEATIRRAAAEAMSTGDRAAEHLSDAWIALYGLNPDASSGYREAVRAVEAAAKPIIVPNDRAATLGRMIAAFRDGAKQFDVVLTEAGANSTPHSVVLSMLSLLWSSQHDRHGTDDPDTPLRVSLEEARAAIHLSITLVQWFRTGVVSRNSTA